MRIITIPSAQLDVKQHIFDSFRQDYAGFDSWFATKVTAQPDRICLVAFEDTNYTAVAILKNDEDAGTHGLHGLLAKLCTFKVRENSTGQSLGSTLLAGVEERMDDGVTLFVEVLPKYEDLVRFFLKHGFSIVENASTIREEIVLAKSYPHSSG